MQLMCVSRCGFDVIKWPSQEPASCVSCCTADEVLGEDRKPEPTMLMTHAGDGSASSTF